MSDNILEQLKELLEGIYFSLNEGKIEETKRANKDRMNAHLAASKKFMAPRFGPKGGTMEGPPNSDPSRAWENPIRGDGVHDAERIADHKKRRGRKKPRGVDIDDGSVMPPGEPRLGRIAWLARLGRR